jgi:pyruvate/2-oxoglutarate dehydrogenase complex dihydrolipoamide dehydrogenase (E3) component
MSEHFDAIVIGAGQAGPPLARRLAAEGQSVAVIERHNLGGSCVNFGCTPTKAMVASARAAWAASRAGDLGVRIEGPVRVDLAAVHAHAQRLVTASRDGIRESLQQHPRIRLIAGHARFVDAGTMRVDEQQLRADRFFIDTGSRAMLPDIPGLAGSGFRTASGMMDLRHLPGQLAILGGGAVGVEYAQMFSRFGSRVRLIERRDRLLDNEDPDVSDNIRQILERDGVEVSTGAELRRVGSSGDALLLEVAQGAETTTVQADVLMLALGRRPNSDELGLEAAGVETDARGYIRVDSALRTNVPHIFALGEVNGHGAFTHTAYEDYRIAADQLFGAGTRSLEDRIPAYAVFLDPPLARVGITEKQARASGRATLIATMPMSGVGRARERAETDGLMKALVDAESQRILGATILGIAGDEAIHCFLTAIAADARYQVLRDMTGIHPTVSELIPTLLEQLRPLTP